MGVRLFHPRRRRGVSKWRSGAFSSGGEQRYLGNAKGDADAVLNGLGGRGVKGSRGLLASRGFR